MNRTFPSWNRPRQPAVAGSTRAVDPSAQRADGYRLLVAVVVLDLGELGIDHVVALRRLAARIARGTGVARRLRSEERRVGKACVSTWRYRGQPSHKKKKCNQPNTHN